MFQIYYAFFFVLDFDTKQLNPYTRSLFFVLFCLFVCEYFYVCMGIVSVCESVRVCVFFDIQEFGSLFSISMFKLCHTSQTTSTVL
jgi:hypothetical protein